MRVIISNKNETYAYRIRNAQFTTAAKNLLRALLAIVLAFAFLLPASSAYASGDISDPVLITEQAPTAQVETKLADNCLHFVRPSSMSCGDPITLDYGVGLQQRLESIAIDGETYVVFPDSVVTDSVELLRVDNSRVQGIRNTVFQANPDAAQAVASIPERWKLVGADMTGRTMQNVIGSSFMTEGTDNTFANRADATMNNIERLSLVNSDSMTAEDPSQLGVLIVERGGNDYFNIAAITAVDANGTPTAWGPISVVSADEWYPIYPNMSSTVLQELPTDSTYTALTWTEPQTVSGVYLSYEDLGISPNQETFGVSMTAGDETSMNPAEWNLETPDIGPGGLDLISTVFVTKAEPGFTLNKTSNPASGESVKSGESITYTVTGHNTGDTVLDPVIIQDDLSEVLSHSSLEGEVDTFIDGVPVSSGGATINGTTLAWAGSLAPGETIEITYTVVVSEDAAGEIISNVVTGSATPPHGPQIEPPPVVTEHPVPGFELDKISNPESGTEVQPGDTVSYTVTGTNTGATVLNPVVIEDDLSDVFSHAAYSGNVSTSINGVPAESGAAVIEGTALSWEGALQPNDVVTITYQVVVNNDATGELIHNRVTGEAQPPVGPSIVPPPVETEHPVPAPGLTINKSSDPVSGSTVMPGQKITYTVTGENTGSTVLDPVVITDDLSGLWEDVTYNNDAFATIDGATSAGAVVIDVAGQQATWAGVLNPGETVTITYSVTVALEYESTYLQNRVTGTGQPPWEGPPISPPPSETEHLIPGFELEKTSTPGDQVDVNPGDLITYTVTGKNTGSTLLDPVTITDDFSKLFGADGSVLVSYPGDATATLSDPSGATSVPVVDFAADGGLTWQGALVPGQTVTITYSVTVLSEAQGHELQNVVSGVAQPPGPDVPPLTPPDRETEHPVPAQGFDLDKTADPEDGSEVHPGQVITYTLTGVNTGDTALDPVIIRDSVAGLSPWATYNVDAAVTTHGVPGAGNLEVDYTGDQEIIWTGALESGEIVTITYSVTVNENATGQVLENKVTGSAQPPGTSTPIIPPPIDTEHPVPEPGFELAKSVNPVSGSAVVPGDVLRYQVVGTNTGETVLDPVVITDDLSGMNEHTTLVGAPIATIDGVWSAGDLDVDFDAGSLVWTGVLEPGETVVISYTVLVNEGTAGATLNNTVVGSAQPPGPDSPPIEPTPPPTENPVPGFTLVKESDPLSDTAVVEGQEILYTLTGVNTGATVLDPVTITDDVSGLKDWATYNNDAIVLIDGEPDTTGMLHVDFEAGTLAWTGMLEPGETLVVSFSVTVNENAAGQLLRNEATGSGKPPGLTPIVPDVPGVEHPVSGFALVKESDPVSGSAVTPGQKITYTLIGTNTGATDLDPVEILDDLSGFSDWVTYNDDAFATVNGTASVGNLNVDFTGSKELSWTSELQVGETVTITYSVTVNDDAVGQVLENVVTGIAQPPGPDVPPIPQTPPPTEHPVAGFEIAKSADPSSGAEVYPGDVITYTVTGTNTGATVLDPVTIEDNLTGLVGYVTFNDDAFATIDGETAAGELDVQYAEGTLAWAGILQQGEAVTITYSVTVTMEASGVLLGNTVESEAHPPGEVPPIVPDRPTTVHPVPVPGFELAKSSDPVSGTQVQPGAKITYTVTGTNTGGTVLDPVVITDDLSNVLKHARYADDAFATIDGRTSAGELTYNARSHEMVWRGALGVGEEVTITYSVQVNADAGGNTLHNTVIASAQPPGGYPPIETPRVGAEHPVLPQLATTGMQTSWLWLAAGAMLLVTAGLTIVTTRRRRIS